MPAINALPVPGRRLFSDTWRLSFDRKAQRWQTGLSAD